MVDAGKAQSRAHNEGDILEQELARRLNAIEAGAYAEADCWQSLRPILVESILWLMVGAGLWFAAMILLV